MTRTGFDEWHSSGAKDAATRIQEKLKDIVESVVRKRVIRAGKMKLILTSSIPGFKIVGPFPSVPHPQVPHILLLFKLLLTLLLLTLFLVIYL